MSVPAVQTETADAGVRGWLRPGEVLLGCGLVLALLSVGIFPSVMVWMLAILTFPLALVFLATGVLRARKSGPVTLNSLKGLLFLVLSLATMGAAALGGYICFL